MAISTVRLDDGVKEETSRIADKLGLTFNSVVNIMLMRFNEEKGFPFPVKLDEGQKNVFDLTSTEFEDACRKAVSEREPVPSMDYVTEVDDSGLIVKKYKDGRVEYVAE